MSQASLGNEAVVKACKDRRLCQGGEGKFFPAMLPCGTGECPPRECSGSNMALWKEMLRINKLLLGVTGEGGKASKEGKDEREGGREASQGGDGRSLPAEMRVPDRTPSTGLPFR